MDRSPWALNPFTNPNQDVFSFRVNPWLLLMLLHILGLISVENVLLGISVSPYSQSLLK